MKVMLINPPKPLQKSYSIFAFAAPKLPPLGLVFIAEIFKQNDWDVTLVDCVLENMSHKELAKIIEQEAPDVIGLTVTTISYKSSQKVVEIAYHTGKKIDKNIYTIMGGAHPSGNPIKTITETKHLDMVVYGEGERTINDFAQRYPTKDIMKIKGTVIRDNKKIVKNASQELIGNLDSITYPDVNKYIQLKKTAHTIARTPYKTLHIVSSRGCPFSCNFCEQTVFGRKWRMYSNEKLVEIIKYNKEKNNIRHFTFEDDTFVLNHKKTEKFCDMLIEENLNISWSCSMRVDAINILLLKKMKKSGCNTIYLGIERKRQDDLDILNKKITQKNIKDKIALVKKEKIQVFGSFILFIPTETKQKIKEIIKYANELRLDGAAFNIFTPYPNINFKRDFLQTHGKISKNFDNYSEHSSSPAYVPIGFDRKDIRKWQKKAYLSFYLNPRYVITNMSKFVDPRLLLNFTKPLKLLFYK